MKNINSKKGISLILLVITIVVIVIIAGTVVFSTRNALKDSNIFDFANKIKTIEETSKIYYLNNNEMPTPEDKKEPIKKSEVLSLAVIPNITELENEFTLNKESEESLYYYIDLSKLDAENLAVEDGEIYIISYPNMYVYYLNGKKLDGKYYFSLTSKIAEVTRIKTDENIENANVDTKTYDGIKVTYDIGYNNKMEMTISTELETNQKLFLSISGLPSNIEKEISNVVGSYNKTIKLLDYYTEAEISKIYDVDANNRVLTVIKKDGTQVVGKNEISLKNFEREIPKILNISFSNYRDMNILKFTATDLYSGIKNIRYDFLTKYSDTLDEVNYYSDITQFDDAYMRTKAKKSPMSNTGLNTITIPKNIAKIVVYVEDNAGNWIIQTSVIPNDMYISEKVIESYKDSVVFNINVLSQNGVSKIDIRESVDGITYTNLESFDFNLNDAKLQKEVKFLNQKEGKKFIKYSVTDNNKTVANRKTYEKTFVLDINNEKPSLVNEPALVSGMIPIKWDEAGNVIITNANDRDWYDYENKKWANAQTLDGSMWVWIPRYEYKIAKPHTSEAQIIDVNFVKETKTTPTTDYIMHPGFTFGEEQVTGIWVAKFEASGTISKVEVKPGVASLRSLTIDQSFTASLAMKDQAAYGWSADKAKIDTHLMKNVEWGAAAYLSSSKYGKTGEVSINNNTSYYTGGGTANSYITNVGQSTTGNVYGIYDMNGGSWERTAAYVNNGNASLTTFGNSLVKADAKYKDVYDAGTSDTKEAHYAKAISKKGDAVYETSSKWEGSTSWYGDYSSMLHSATPFFVRGGSYGNGTAAGAFHFNNITGNSLSSDSFRPALLVSLAL